jgi:hypothetical protein
MVGEIAHRLISCTPGQFSSASGVSSKSWGLSASSFRRLRFVPCYFLGHSSQAVGDLFIDAKAANSTAIAEQFFVLFVYLAWPCQFFALRFSTPVL